MFKLNSFCKECFDPHKIIWSCKKHFSEKNWIARGGNCIRYFKNINGKNFRSQFQNIKSFIKCRVLLKKLELPFYELKY